MKVLQVDDEPDILNQTKIYLERDGGDLSVDTAISVKEALKILDEEKYDCIISDYQMPEMDGLDFLEKIRDEKNSDIPFIVFTGKGREEVAVRALNLGADRYLQKGGDPRTQYGVLREAIVGEVRERERKRELRRYKSAVRASSDSIYMLDRDLSYVFANDEHLRRLKEGGVLPEEGSESIVGRNYEEMHSKEEFEAVKGKVKEVMKSGKPQRGVFYSRNRDRYSDRTYSPIRDFDFEGLAGVIIVSKDITDLKKKDEMVRESEERYRRLFETAQDGMLIVDVETGEIEDANPFIQEILGYSKEELIGKELWEIGPFGKIAENRERFQELVEEGYIRYEDLPLRTKEGEDVPVEFVSNTYEAGGQEVLQCNVREISKRKESERKLRRERRRFEEIFNNANDAIYLHELEENGMPGNFVEVNKVACEMLGYSENEFMEMSPLDIDSSDKLDELPGIMEELSKEGDLRFEMIHETKDGKEIPVEIHSHLFELEGSEMVLSLARDISERKETEEILKRYKMAVEGSSDLMAACDRSYRYTFANEVYREYHGLDSEEIIGRKLRDVLGPDSFEKNVRPNVDSCLNGERVEYEMEREHPELGVRTLDIFYYPLRVEEGEIRGAVAVMRDITERKRREKKLRESERRLKKSQRVAKVGSWDIDLDTGNLAWSDETYRIFGVPEGDPVDYEKLLDLVHPEDEDYLKEKWNEALETGKYDIEHRILVDGETKWVRERAEVRFDEEGEPVEVIGSVQDITERKESEKKLRFQAQLLDQVENAVIATDLDGKITYWNEKAEELYGWSEEEVIGENILDVTPSMVSKENAENIMEMLVGGERWSGEFQVQRKDGTEFPAIVTDSPIYDEDGNLIGIVGVTMDITERKEAEERERFLHSLLRHDVRNKSQLVEGYLELAEDFDIPPKLGEYLEKARRATEEGIEIIEKVRALRRIEEEDFDAVEIDSIVREVVEENRASAREKGMEIEVDCPHFGCKVQGGSLLEELFSNLIGNSIKHSDGSLMRIGGRELQDTLVCIVEDDGKGVPDEIKERVFDRGFKRGEAAGSGLGLYLAKNIVESYGGKLEVADSELGGAKFDVYLKKKE
ncbi:MAG: PAS domain S-box protein [Candidatus Hadarchaeota archaeon]